MTGIFALTMLDKAKWIRMQWCVQSDPNDRWWGGGSQRLIPQSREMERGWGSVGGRFSWGRGV